MFMNARNCRAQGLVSGLQPTAGRWSVLSPRRSVLIRVATGSSEVTAEVANPLLGPGGGFGLALSSRCEGCEGQFRHVIAGLLSRQAASED